MTNHRFHVGIVGGGIGGLALAQGLTKAGLSVAVYERDRTSTDRLQGDCGSDIRQADWSGLRPEG